MGLGYSLSLDRSGKKDKVGYAILSKLLFLHHYRQAILFVSASSSSGLGRRVPTLSCKKISRSTLVLHQAGRTRVPLRSQSILIPQSSDHQPIHQNAVIPYYLSGRTQDKPEPHYPLHPSNMAGQSKRARALLELHISDLDIDVEELFDNIDGSIDSYLVNRGRWVRRGDDAVRKADGAMADRRLLPFASPSPEEDILPWFEAVSREQVDGARGVWRTCCHLAPETGLASTGAHIFLTFSPTFDSGSNDGWRHIQVVGQFCRDDSIGYREGLVSLCGHACKVFASQPTRPLLHGFYIRRTRMELWAFDRSGIYCHGALDIHDEPTRFISILLGYRLMADQDLGRNEIIKTDESGSFITLTRATTAGPADPSRLYLEEQAIALSEEVVGQGTVCYRARTPDSSHWDHIVKFKWRLARDRREEDFLKRAGEKNVYGVVSLVYHNELDSTANVRRGFRLGRYRKFLTTQQQRTAAVVVREEEVGAQLESTHDASAAHGGILEQTEETDKAFVNRTLACIVTFPAGRPLRTFKSRLELLRVLRDAIRAHRSLLQDAHMLHQDVSAQNIIIVDARRDEGEGENQKERGDKGEEQAAEESRGIMIDLDVAMILEQGPRTPGEVTGTRPFMAVGILKERRHTYRHDLESFLYVFLWVVISNRAQGLPTTSRLRLWSNGSWEESAMAKMSDMEEVNFRNGILAEFPPEFRSLGPLAETLRQLLFPVEDGVLWTGTVSALSAVNGLYDGIIGAFDGAIMQEKSLRGGEGST